MANTLEEVKYMGLEPIVWKETSINSKPWFYGQMYAGPKGDAFLINMGGPDYYASEESLNVEQATKLRDMINDWLSAA